MSGVFDFKVFNSKVFNTDPEVPATPPRILMFITGVTPSISAILVGVTPSLSMDPS